MTRPEQAQHAPERSRVVGVPVGEQDPLGTYQ